MRRNSLADHLLFLMDERDRAILVYKTLAQSPSSSTESIQKVMHMAFPDIERIELLARRKSLKLLNRYLTKKFAFMGTGGAPSLEVLNR